MGGKPRENAKKRMLRHEYFVNNAFEYSIRGNILIFSISNKLHPSTIPKAPGEKTKKRNITKSINGITHYYHSQKGKGGFYDTKKPTYKPKGFSYLQIAWQQLSGPFSKPYHKTNVGANFFGLSEVDRDYAVDFLKNNITENAKKNIMNEIKKEVEKSKQKGGVLFK